MNDLCFDYAEVLKRLGDDEELFCAMARCFVEDVDCLLREIGTGDENGEPKRVERAAHSLKGLAATFSASTMLLRAQSIELCGRQGDLAKVQALLPELTAESEKLKSALLPFAHRAGD